MNRRDFFTNAGKAVFVVGCGAAGGFAGKEARDTAEALAACNNYKPVGYLGVGEVGAVNVDYVTLDGLRIGHVFELDDVEGWLRHYKDLNSYTRPIYRTGQVRVYWKAVA